ncbi:urease subunit beta [Paenibacillus sp. NPDC058177]|uniref:urease subunit beta n=1 Tax=Paenibacillus sp. NPDC058177 TaxID=3346369 RepID=UPI0036D812D2
MIPGEYRTQAGWIELNAGRATEKLIVVNLGDRPIQIGSHFHFFEVNRALLFDRELAFGMRLNIPAGTAVRFEPGEEKPVELVTLGGNKCSYGLSAITNGPAEKGDLGIEVKDRLQAWKGVCHAQDRP